MVQPLVALFWFAAGAAYLCFGIANWASVRFLVTVQGNALKKLADAVKKAVNEETRLASNSPEEIQSEEWEAAVERKVQELLLADPEVTKLAVNQKILRIGALSFFFAGVISFAQGFFVLAGW